jgi:hypothetical protein
MTRTIYTSDTDRRVAELLDDADVAPRADLVVLAHAYLVRTRRARWFGGLGAITFAYGAWWFGSHSDALGLSFARFFAGYLVGSIVAERALVGLDRRDLRSASLAPRTASSLLPLWARVGPWLVLPPAAATPLLLLGEHPRGVSRIHTRTSSGFASGSWFSSATLTGVSVTAVVTLVLAIVVTRRLAHRPLVLDDSETARLDLVMRRRSARCVAGAATALGLQLLAGVCFLGVGPAISQVCTGAGVCRPVYRFVNAAELQNLAMLLVALGFVVFLVARRRTRLERRSADVALQR